MKSTLLVFFFLSTTLWAKAQQDIQAELQWIDTKGESTVLNWKSSAQWTWQKRRGGGAIPKLHLWIEYPAHFPFLESDDASVKLNVAKGPFPERPGFRTLLIEETEALFTKTLPYQGTDGKKETGGLAVTLSFDEPAVLVHDSCAKEGLQLNSAEDGPKFFYLGFFCHKLDGSLDVTLHHSQDVSELKGGKRIPLTKKGESHPLRLTTQPSKEVAEYELAWAKELGEKKNHPSEGGRLQAALSPLYLSFKGSSSEDHFSEMSLLARIAGEFPLKRNSALHLTAELAVTPFTVLHPTRSTAPASLLFANVRLKSPLSAKGTSPRFTFEAGPLFMLSDLPTRNRDTLWGVGPQIVFALEGRLFNAEKRPDRLWAEVSFLNFGSFTPSLDNPRLGLGFDFPFSAFDQPWQLSLSVSNTQYGSSAVRNKGHLATAGIELQTSL